MDFNRRLASGRTAEILGKQSIPLDRWMRTLSFRQVVEKEIALLDPLTLNMLQAYSEGINARIEEGRLPVEFNLLRYKPENGRYQTA
jgi:penicillin amidase